MAGLASFLGPCYLPQMLVTKICSECGDEFDCTQSDPENGYYRGLKSATCSEDCARARKTRLQRERRHARPKRIQRKRTAGWRMPAGAIYVGRPTFWGNPYKVGEIWLADPVEVPDVETAVELYRRWIVKQEIEGLMQTRLRGKDLACWCRPGDPCHADVLLELANA